MSIAKTFDITHFLLKAHNPAHTNIKDRTLTDLSSAVQHTVAITVLSFFAISLHKYYPFPINSLVVIALESPVSQC